jgi:hypothetical protein
MGYSRPECTAHTGEGAIARALLILAPPILAPDSGSGVGAQHAAPQLAQT